VAAPSLAGQMGGSRSLDPPADRAVVAGLGFGRPVLSPDHEIAEDSQHTMELIARRVPPPGCFRDRLARPASDQRGKPPDLSPIPLLGFCEPLSPDILLRAACATFLI